jgi:hypothetical protein
MRTFLRLGLVACLTSACLFAQVIGRPDDRENTAPTPWFTYAAQTPADIANAVGQGLRLTDLKIDDPLLHTYTVCYVPNAGAYQTPFWWLLAVDQPTLQGFAQANQAIITNLTAWQGPGGGTLFSATLEPNFFRRTWWWFYDITAAQFYNDALALGARPTSISQYARNGGAAFAGVMVANVGSDQRAWWMYHGISRAQMDGFLLQNSARLWSLLPDGNGLLTCVMIANPGNAWWYAIHVTGPQLIAFANARGARVMDALRTGGTVTGVMLGNFAALGRVGQLMRAVSDGVIGYYLKEVNGAVVDAFNEQFVFEPASVLKTLHHFHAMDAVLRRAIALNTPIQVFLAAQGSCPLDANPVQEQLGQVLARMMQLSDNNRTQAIVARFGAAAIQGSAAALGMVDTSLNHRIGCLGPIPNTATLVDLGTLHERVANGALGAETANFRAIMLNQLPGYAGGALQNVIQNEALAVGLNAAQLAGFLANLRLVYKDGVYVFGNGAQHRAWAAWLSLPHRVGGNVQAVEYVTGSFVNGASNFAGATAAANLGAGEVVRPALNLALRTWLGGQQPGAFVQFGAGCRGSHGAAPVHFGTAINQNPVIGGPVSYELAQAPPGRFAAIQLGTSNTLWNGIPLPLRLDFLGMRGCTQWIAPAFEVYLFTDAAGTATLPIVLPPDPALVGVSVFTQGLITDPPSPGFAITTNGLETVIGG